MFWARLIGGAVALLYLAVFLWTLKKRGTDYFLGREGIFRLLSVFLGVFFGLTLALRPPFAPWAFLLCVLNGVVSSWAEYFRSRRQRRRIR
jgi:hypothetical protein